MSASMKTVLKTELGVFLFWIYENGVKDCIKCFIIIIIIIITINIIILNCFLFAFAMTAACKSYLALKVENFLPHVSFIYLCFFSLFIALPPPFQFVLSLAQATLV